MIGNVAFAVDPTSGSATSSLAAVTAAPTTSTKRCEMSIPLAAIDNVRGRQAKNLRLVYVNDDAPDYAPNAGYIRYKIVR